MKTKIAYILFFSLILSGYSQNENLQGKIWTLQECVDYAIDNNITVKQNEYDIALAEVDKKDAIGNYLPDLNINGSHAWNRGLTTDVSTGVLINQTTQTSVGGLSSGILIYGGMRNLNELRRSELNILANRYKLDKIKDDISLFVINAYLDVLFSKEALNVAIPQLEISRDQLRRTNQLVEAGTIPKGDLLDIQATLANDEQNLIITQNNVRLSLLSLAQLLQLEDFNNFQIAESEISTLPLVNLGDYSVEQIYEVALQNRYEIKVAETNIDLAEKDIKIARASKQPTLSGFYNWNTRASNRDQIVDAVPDLDNPFNVIGIVEGTGQNVLAPNTVAVIGGPDSIFDQFGDNRGSSFGLSLSIPVLNGFRASNRVKRAEIIYEQQKYQLDQEELDLQKIIHTVYADAIGALKLYEATQISVDAQNESFRYAQEKFDVGVLNSFDFSQIKNRVVQAESDFLRAKYDFIFKVKLLEFYYGIPVTIQ